MSVVKETAPHRGMTGRVLVTGGSGFLGSWIVDRLLAADAKVRVFDRAISASTLDAVRPGNAARVEAVEGDIVDEAAVTAAASGCDAIIHLAGMLTAACRKEPVLSAKVNVLGGMHVFEAARKCGIRRMAYVSSAGVFGPVDGAHPQPATLYGTHKLAMEGFARAYLADHGIAATGFRPYIVYGPGEGSGISAGPSSACKAAVAGEPFDIRFTGRVGFVHVADVADAFVAAVSQERDSADVFNLCGETADMNAFIEAIVRHVPSARISASGPPMPIAPDLEIGAPPAWLAALKTTPLADGVAQTIDHWRRLAGADA